MNKLLWSIGHIVKQRTNMRGYPVPTPSQKLNGDTLNLFLWNFKTIISSNPWIFFFASQNISIDRATSRSIIFPNLRSNWIFSFAQDTMCNSTQHTCESAFREIPSKKNLKYSLHKQPKQGSTFRKCMRVKYLFNLIKDIAATSTNLRGLIVFRNLVLLKNSNTDVLGVYWVYIWLRFTK